ncbi:MAG: translation initiation factor IF-2, partial [Candidatus Hydrogenedentes bacterium]|nr:translation initiation factor IF-2 [Candidatus Hydrogenedentota bacterium]
RYMQTVSSLADRLDVSPEWAIERLRYMLIDVENVESTIGDEACDLLIEVADDPAVADRVRETKLSSIEKEKKKKEKLRLAAQKSAETRRKAAAKKKPATAKKPGAAAVEGDETVLDAETVAHGAEPGHEDAAHPMPEIIRGESAEALVTGEVLAPEDKVQEKTKEKAKEKPKAKPKKAEEKPKGPEIVIGAAVVKDEPLVEVVRADGTHVQATEIELPEAEAAEVEEEEEFSPVLAEAERRQEEEEERKSKLAARPLAKPDPAVVAEVQRRAAERQQRMQVQRVIDQRKGGTGKTARKRQKRAEKQRAEESMRRNAAAAVRTYAASGMLGPGARKRKRRRGRDEDDEMDVIEQAATPSIIEVEDTMSLEDLAASMEVPVNDVILDLMDLNIMATKNQTLTIDVIRKIAEPRGFEIRSVIPEEDKVLAEEPDDPASLRPRAPVITVMGHVDHGKTTFLDRVRTANVAEGEAGGITQHIAAYDVPIGDGRVVFLDTPGHEAFTHMRARGAQATDIVVLVVAADDGVMPQTIEAIDHAKAANVPIVVAVNKIDKPDAQPDRIRQELTRFELVDEAWGGKTIIRNISAKKNEGIGELLELLVLQSEMLELKANPSCRARGVIIESEISRGQGPVAWVLVQKGTLRVGDVFLAGETYGRVRSLHNSKGEAIQEAGPATPVVVTGFSAPPNAGDQFAAVEDERAARAIAEKRADYSRQKQGRAVRRVTLEDFHQHMLAGEKNILNVVLKADVQGSVDVLESSLAKVGNEEVEVRLVHTGVGGINESDILLASASNAVIIGFHVTASPRAQKLAEQEGVDIRTYRVIYEAIEDVRLALEGMLTPESKEIVTGHVEIRQVFRSSSLGNIAGCYVTDGEVHRGAMVRLLRDSTIVYQGRIATLRREKDDARSVATGYECGIKLESYEDIKVGDVIEAYRVESVAKTLA